ncbi:MAG: tail fiber domain-containing protein [Bacteroidales bacterium]|nr:tail fiber domain-containing protein [Bacteroidales bacterium]
MKLKQIILPALLATAGTTASAQDLPNSFNYQAVINSDDGNPVAKKDITVEVSILQGTDCDQSKTCPVLWQELHTPTTNEFGLFNIEIGSSSAKNTHKGSVSSYSDIKWLDVTDGYYYMQVRVDFGASSYLNGLTDLGITKFSAVPYSLVALQTDLSERSKTLTKDDNGNVDVKLGELSDVDVASAAEDQVLTFDGTKWTPKTVTSGGGVSVSKLSELTGDVAISSPAKDQHLIFNGTKWVNSDFSGGSTATKLNDLSDVTTASISAPNVFLKYNGTKWVNSNIKLLEDITFPTATDGAVLTYSASLDKWKASNLSVSLEKLTDVKLGTTTTDKPKNGDVLTYSEGKWINQAGSAESVWKSSTNGIYTDKHVGIGGDPSNVFDIKKDGSPTASTHIHSDGQHLWLTAGSISMGGTSAIIKDGASSAIAGKNGTAGQNCIAFGDPDNTDKADASAGINCIAFGRAITISGRQIFAFGIGLSSSTDNQLLCGKYNKKNDDALFIVGNGTGKDETNRTNVFEVLKTGNATLSGTLNGSSDVRLKSHISTTNNCLEKVLKMRGVNFYWDKTKRPSAESKMQYGFIAQEMEKIIPELVSEGADGYKTINYIGVIPVLTNAIKEQQDQIKDLKQENEELKSTLEELIKRVNALEKK